MRHGANVGLVLCLLAAAGAADAAPAVVQGRVNLRAGPGLEFPVVAVMQPGTPVEAFECGGGWCRVAYRGHSGFASMHFVDFGDAAYAAPLPLAAPYAPPLIGYGFRWREGWRRGWGRDWHHHWRYR